jgi:protein-tyrosine phosphatase
MIDLHSHILPGIDDGARSLQESVEMCRLAAAEGCTAMVATPHQRRGIWWNSDLAQLAALRTQLQRALGSTLQVHPGGEIHVDSQLLAEIEQLPDEAGILPLAGSRYLLIEFDSSGNRRDAAELIHELVVSGWRPILAHPEFIPWLAADFALLDELVGLGATSQVTAMSVTGDFGRQPQQITHGLIDSGLVHFIASDCHGPRRRPPGLKRAYQTVAARWGEEAARLFLIDGPQAVIEDRPLASLQPAPAPESPAEEAAAGAVGDIAGPTEAV